MTSLPSPAVINSAVQPAVRPDYSPEQRAAWLKRHEEFVARARQCDVDVLFLGDSLTDGWRLRGQPFWARDFAPLKAANFGISGDRTQQVLWRIENGELDGIQPKLVVLLIGTNNTGPGFGDKSLTPKNTPEEIVAGVAAIVATLRAKQPNARILVLGIFPRGEITDPLRVEVAAINAGLRNLAESDAVHFSDFTSQFQATDGSLSRELMPDLLHLSERGYAVFADALRPVFLSLLPITASAIATVASTTPAAAPKPRPLSRIGLGCATFGREIPEATAFALMDYAVDHGITVFDTAEAYGGGQARAARRKLLGVDDAREVSDEMYSSEKIVGRWLRARGLRDRVTLVTKVTRNFQRDQVRTALEASLQRLQTDQVDFYLYHSHDTNTPVNEANHAMDAIVAAGLARAGGCSNYSGAQLQVALEDSERSGLRRFEILELGYNLLKPQPDAFAVVAREKLAVLAYSPLAAGFLSGKYTPDRASIPKGTRFDVSPAHIDLYFTEENFRRVALLHDLATRIGVPPLQLAMAWVFQNPLVTTVLVGARNESHLANALAAAELSLAPGWLDEIVGWDLRSSAQAKPS